MFVDGVRMEALSPGSAPLGSLDDTPPAQLASATAITANLIAAGLGTGLLTLPWGAAGASIVTSAVLIALVLLLNGWIIMLTVRACERFNEFDLGGLLRHLPGRLGPLLMTVGDSIILFSQFLVLLGYIIVIVDSLEFLLPGGTIFGNRTLLTAMTAVCILPVCFLDQRLLAFTSTFSIMANVYLILLLVKCAFNAQFNPVTPQGPALDVSGVCILGFAPGVITQCDLLMYTVIILMMIPPMYKELEGRSPEKFQKCLTVGFVAIFFILVLVMICGYIAFGPHVDSNVLMSLPKDVFGSAAQFAMAVCIFGCFPLNVKPCVAPFARPNETPRKRSSRAGTPLFGSPMPKAKLSEPLVACEEASPLQVGADSNGAGYLEGSSAREVVATVAVVGGVSVCSFWIHSLGPLNAINGTIQVLGYIGLIPGAIGLYLSGHLSPLRKLAMWGLIIGAVLTTLIGFIYTDNYVDALSKTCFWTL